MSLPYVYLKQTPRGSVVVLETILGERLLTDEMTHEEADAFANQIIRQGTADVDTHLTRRRLARHDGDEGLP